MRLQLFNQFNEKFDFNNLSDEELDEVEKSLIKTLNELKLGILQSTRKSIFSKIWFSRTRPEFPLADKQKEYEPWSLLPAGGRWQQIIINISYMYI